MSNKKFSLSTLLISVFLAIVFTFQITFVTMQQTYRYENDQTLLTNTDEAEKLNQVVQMMQEYCIYDINETLSSDYALAAYLMASGDPYAQYFTPQEYAALLSADTGNNVGIGIVVTDHQKGLLITSVVTGSPAEAEGVLAGDIITGTEEGPFDDLDYAFKANILLGEEGQTVRLDLLRGEDAISISVTRKAYESISVRGYMLPDQKTALVRIDQFNSTTAKAIKELTASLVKEGAEGFIYDLRGNPGGTLESIVEVLDYLLPEGLLVTLENRSGIQKQFSSDANRFDYPAVILTSDTTASAAELFAACMRDYEAAILVGDTTYDVIGAAHHGIPTVGVAWGYGKVEDMQAAGAAAIANTMEELLALLTKSSFLPPR